MLTLLLRYHVLLQLVTEMKYFMTSLEFPYGVPNETLQIRAAIDSG